MCILTIENLGFFESDILADLHLVQVELLFYVRELVGYPEEVDERSFHNRVFRFYY